MKNAILFAALAFAAAVGALSTPTPAQAQEYAWCLDTGRGGSLGDCKYSTYQQCKDTASGRGGTCNRNPRLGLNEWPSGPRTIVR